MYNELFFFQSVAPFLRRFSRYQEAKSSGVSSLCVFLSSSVELAHLRIVNPISAGEHLSRCRLMGCCSSFVCVVTPASLACHFGTFFASDDHFCTISLVHIFLNLKMVQMSSRLSFIGAALPAQAGDGGWRFTEFDFGSFSLRKNN